MRKRIWLPNQKPPAGSQLIRSHELARNLQLAVIYNEAGGNLVRNLVGHPGWISTTGSPVWEMTARGYGKNYNASGRYDSFTPNMPAIGTGDCCLVIGMVRRAAGGAYQTLLNFNNYDPQWYINGSGTISVYDTSAISTTTTIPLDTPTNAVWNRKNGVLRAYTNGVFGSERNWSDSVGLTANFRIGCSVSAGEYFSGVIYYLYFYNRSLTDGEIAWLHAEPYAMFQPRKKQRYWLASAAPATLQISVHDCTDTFESLH